MSAVVLIRSMEGMDLSTVGTESQVCAGRGAYTVKKHKHKGERGEQLENCEGATKGIYLGIYSES